MSGICQFPPTLTLPRKGGGDTVQSPLVSDGDSVQSPLVSDGDYFVCNRYCKFLTGQH
jgi:hypothetical protein